MEVQPVDIDNIRRILESAFNVAIFPDAIPHPVRPGFLVQDAGVWRVAGVDIIAETSGPGGYAVLLDEVRSRL